MTELCDICGAGPSYRIPVWEDMEDYEDGKPPDFRGCTECGTMERIDEEVEDA